MNSLFVLAIFCCLVHVCSWGLSIQKAGVLHRRTHTVRAPSELFMAARQSGGGGGTALDTKIDKKSLTKSKSQYQEEIEKDWRLILHDDTVHTIQEVCDIVAKNVPLCPGPRAYEVTLEVHMTGAGTVCIANRKLVEEYTKKLQREGLTVSMAPDDEFEAGDEDGDGGEE